MNSPYMGDFRVTQRFTEGSHDGLDLVGIKSKEIHSTVSGKVVYAGWENPDNHTQGFGQYVCILAGDKYYYFGHMSEIKVKTNDTVNITDVIGIEGSTGYSTGSHCHYEVRYGFYKGAKVENINRLSGIPNECGIYNDGYVWSGPTQPTNQIEYDLSVVKFIEFKNGKLIISFD